MNGLRSLVCTAALLVVAASSGPACRREGAGAENGLDVKEPPFDSMPPPVLPDEPAGSYGFTHYVFARVDDTVETVLVEGPRGEQVRCQSAELPCSYLELKELHESGAEIPEALHMTRVELAELVSQLDQLAATLARYESIDHACAQGYHPTSTQAHNMGIHMTNEDYIRDGVLDLDKPDMLLFGMEGGERLTRDQLGDCVDGKWTGDPHQEIVGAAFLIPTPVTGEAHPDGFAGPLDNWHVHYNNCRLEQSDSFLSEEECVALGGRYTPKSPWMLHAYAVPKFDSQSGVFAMWNESIWPRMDASRMQEARTLEAAAGPPPGRVSRIVDFQFEQGIELQVGEPLTIRNADFMIHTVTAGTPDVPREDFDSGPLYTGESFTLELDEPGEYDFFCEHHPAMRGKVVVK